MRADLAELRRVLGETRDQLSREREQVAAQEQALADERQRLEQYFVPSRLESSSAHRRQRRVIGPKLRVGSA